MDSDRLMLIFLLDRCRSIGVCHLERRFSVSYVLFDPRGIDRISARLRTSARFTMIKLIITNKGLGTGKIFSQQEVIGVKAFQSNGSKLMAVSAYELGACSTQQRVVLNTSSAMRRLPRIVHKKRVKLRNNFSQMPRWCSAPGGLILHFICLMAGWNVKPTVLQFPILSRSYFSAYKG